MCKYMRGSGGDRGVEGKCRGSREIAIGGEKRGIKGGEVGGDESRRNSDEEGK